MSQISLPPLDAAWDPTLETEDSDEYCWTPLQLAARSGNIPQIRAILASHPAAVNEPPCGYYGQTALQAACMHEHEEAVQLLVDAGADLHFSGGNNFQRNALQIACGLGNERIVDRLLQAGARVEEISQAVTDVSLKSPKSVVSVTRYNGRTALQAACDRGHLDLVRRLLKHGAHVNAPPSPTAGRTALQAAARGGYLPIIQLLLENGADVNAEAATYKGFTALQGASLYGCGKIVELLLAEGADVDGLGGLYGDGMALHAAAQEGQVAIIEQLISAGADVNAYCSRRGRGQTALQSAAAGGHEQALQALRRHGAVGRSAGGRFLFD